MRPRLSKAAIGATALILGAGALAVVTYDHLPDLTTARLPGAAGGDHTYQVTADFQNVLDLVPNATVRLADVPVGRVTSIHVGTGGPSGHYAEVGLAIDDAYALPADTSATIENTSLLGEKYVALTAPAHGTGSLEHSQTIPLAHTTEDVEVEQLLSSFGALLNGGGLEQLSVITQQFSQALGGHERSTRELLGDLDRIVSQLQAGRAQIVAAIDGAERLSAVYAAQKQVLGRAIDGLDPATGVLARQEPMLVHALRSLRQLDRTATPLIRASTSDTVADLDALGPITQRLGVVADRLPRVLTTVLTYPFPDDSLAAFSDAYSGSGGVLTLDLPQLLAQIVPSGQSTDSDDSGSASHRTRKPTQPSSPSGSPTSSPSPSGGLPQQLLGGIGSLLGGGGSS